MANTPKFLPGPWTKEDVLFLIQQVDAGKFILVADPNLGIPTIHHKFPAEVVHAGMGLMVVKTPAYELSFDAGGSMQKTPGGQSWTELRVDKGGCPLNLAGLRSRLAALLALPTEPAEAGAVGSVDERMAGPDPAPEAGPQEAAAPGPAANETAEAALPLDLGEMVEEKTPAAKEKAGKKSTLKVNKADLARLLSIVLLGANDKNAFRVEAQKETKRLIVTGFDSAAATAIEGHVQAEAGADIVVYVPATTFKGALETMPEGPVTIKIAGPEMKIEATSKNKHTLQLMTDVDFPVVYGNEATELFTMPGAEAKRLMMASKYAASVNSSEGTAKVELTTVALATQKSHRSDYPLIVDARAASGYSGAIIKSFGMNGKDGVSLALSAATLSLANKILVAGGNLGETVVAFGRVGDGKYHLSFKVGGVAAVLATPEPGARIDAAQFDAVIASIKANPEKATVEFDASELLTAIKSVELYATDKDVPSLYLEVAGGKMRFAGQKTAAGECHGEIASAKIGEGSKDAFRLFGLRVFQSALADLRRPKMIVPVTNMQVVLVEGGTLILTAPLVVPNGFKRPAFEGAGDEAPASAPEPIHLPAEAPARQAEKGF
jgi:hypothetical protein